MTILPTLADQAEAYVEANDILEDIRWYVNQIMAGTVDLVTGAIEISALGRRLLRTIERGRL